MSIHPFSWKLKKSLWALTSLLFLAWVGFFYIGNKADNKKWKFAGVVYIITQLGTVILSLPFKNGSPVDNALFSIWFAMYFVGIIHSILTIRPYLRFCEEAENGFSDADPATARPASLNTPDSSRQTPLSHAESDLVPKMQEARYTEPDYSAVPEDYVPSDAFAAAAQRTKSTAQGVSSADGELHLNPVTDDDTEAAQNTAPAQDTTTEQSSEAVQPVNPAAGASQPEDSGIVILNSCTAGQLAALPGMTAEKAERALAYRHENGGFLSIDEFIAVVDVPVQEEEKLRARIILG
jgi:DNA uptake protein ComE-like DNA-binding protein